MTLYAHIRTDRAGNLFLEIAITFLLTLLIAVAVSLMGTAIIFVPGLLWLAVLFGWNASVLESGLYPFVLGGLFKFLLVGLFIGGAWRLTRKSVD